MLCQLQMHKYWKTRNSSGDEIANVNFLYDDIVHALENQIKSNQNQIARLFCSWWSFFVNRIDNVWNFLPDCIVTSNSVVAFRQKLKQLHFSDFCNTWNSHCCILGHYCVFAHSLGLMYLRAVSLPLSPASIHSLFVVDFFVLTLCFQLFFLYILCWQINLIWFAINDKSLKTSFCGLHVRCRKYWRIFNHFYVIHPESYRILWNYTAVRAITPFKVIQGHRVWYQSKVHMRLPISD